MKERFKQLPEPLQQQVIRRFAIAIVFVLLFFITLFGFWDVIGEILEVDSCGGSMGCREKSC